MRLWPKRIELSVFNGPEVLERGRVLSDTKATYWTADDQEIKVKRDEEGQITEDA